MADRLPVPPKPLFVIGDVESNSYTTALFSTKLKLPPQIGNKHQNVLICGTNDGEIIVWSLENYQCLFRSCSSKSMVKGDILRINSITTVQNNSRLLVDFKVSDILLLDLLNDDMEEMKLIERWKSYETTFSKCFHLEKKNMIAFLSPNNPNLIELIDLNLISTGRNIQLKLCSDRDHGIVMTMNLFVDTKNDSNQLYILISYEDGFVLLYLAQLSSNFKQTSELHRSYCFDAKQISEYKSHSDMVTCLDFHQESMRGISCSVDNQIKLWQIIDDKSLQIVENSKNSTIQIKNEGILSCSIRPDGRIFGTGGKDGRIRLFTLKAGKPLVVLDYHSNAIECVTFTSNLNSNEDSEDDKSSNYLLVASSRDQSISIWSLYNT